MVRRATAAALAVAITLVGCGGSRPDFGRGSVADVVAALEREQLEVCGPPTSSDALANQALVTHTVFVAVDCHDEILTLLVDRFGSAEDRDAAARNFESQLRPRGDGAVWVWGPLTIAAIGARPDRLMDRVTDALEAMGAE